jgi:hypothetical protein
MLLLLLGAAAVHAQSPAPAPPQPAPFKPEEIEALVAPVALYPDSLLSQVLMASTYPLEIVYAARWVKANPKLKGEDAVKAVESQTWDISVKSLVAFPQILEPMSDKLDWTQKLGDAFLAQEKDVLAAVQRLRARADKSGNLKSNEQQKVIVEAAPETGQTIVKIEPANPQVIYVPAYNPTVVYGSWGYPTYPPYYWPPSPAYYPGAALATGFAWGVGLAAAGAMFGNCNWGGGDVNINVDKARNVDRSFDRTKVEGGRWKHDSSHRQGVAYRDNASREKYSRNVSGADARSDFRGRESGAGERNGSGARGDAGNRGTAGDRGGAGAGGGNRATTADRSGSANRAAAADRPNATDRPNAGDRSAGGDRMAATDRSSAANRAGTSDRGGGGGGYGGGRDNAFQGVDRGSSAQRSYDRGRASAQASSFNRGGGGGGMSRGGGGGGRGRR